LPRVSVILPVYNGEKHLAKAIESVLLQSFTDFELLILNDGSTDMTQDIIDSYSYDSRVRPIQHSNMGLIKTLNKGLGLANGQFVARMDADDICHAERLKVQYSKFLGDPNLSVLGSAISLIDEHDEFLRNIDYPKSSNIDSFIRKGSPVAHPAVMMKLKDIRDIGGYRDAFDSAEDYDLWYRLHDAGYKIDNCSEVLLNYRQTMSGISFSQSNKQAVITRIVQMAHDMRVLAGQDSFNHSKSASIVDLKAGLDRYIDTEEFAKYELIWFGVYHLNNENLTEVDTRFRQLTYELSLKAQALYFLKRAYVNRINKNYTRFLIDLTKSSVMSPRLILNIIRSRLK